VKPVPVEGSAVKPVPVEGSAVMPVPGEGSAAMPVDRGGARQPAACVCASRLKQAPAGARLGCSIPTPVDVSQAVASEVLAPSN
jgi:hypothetical protein